jgi:DNA-binding transcriptional LysR family regulator
MRSLNLDQLRALEMVVELGSFTVAAQRLSLSQSAVSTQIRELEERFGLRLVDRLGKKAFATAAGAELIAHAKRIGGEVEAIHAAMRRQRDGWLGRVRIGAGPNTLTYLMPPILKELRATQPKIEVSVRTGVTTDLAALALRNEIDLALITLPYEDKQLEIVPLRADAMVAIFSPMDGPLPDAVTPRDFEGRNLILDGRSQTDRMSRAWLRAGEVEPKPAMEVGGPEAMVNLCATGLGSSILPVEVVAGPYVVPRGDIILRPLEPPLVRAIALAWRRDKPNDPALRIVREALMTLKDVPISPVFKGGKGTARSVSRERKKRRSAGGQP